MITEEKLPEKFRITAYHPSLFVYAFKRTVLDKLLEEFMQSNIAILGGEAWVAEEDRYFGIIPLKNGDKSVLSWKVKRISGEDWFDFVERSAKESISAITEANLEKKVSAFVRNKLFYHFNLEESPG